MEKDRSQQESNFSEKEVVIIARSAIVRFQIEQIMTACESRYSSDMMNI